MNKRSQRTLIVTGSLLVSAVAVAFFAYRVAGHRQEVWMTLRSAGGGYLALSVALLAVLYLLRIVRWRLFLRHIADIRWLSLTSATLIGFTANNILPARLGELIRPYLLSKREKVSMGHALGSIGLARLFDLIGLSLLLILTWFILSLGGTHQLQHDDNPPPETASETVSADVSNETVVNEKHNTGMLDNIWKAGIVVTAMAAAGTIILLLVALYPSPVLRVAEFCAQILPGSWRSRAVHLVHSLTETMGFLKDWRGVTGGVALSAGVWLFQGLSTWAVAEALGLSIGPAGAFLAVIAVCAAVAVPQGPGFLGTFHLAASLVAEAFHTPVGQAAAFAMLMWVINIIPVTLAGLVFLVYEGAGLRRLSAESQSEKED
ncbi:MAG: lysylphosphatidylglycerol synthase transmembrane domain-containing protein [Planctomycetota bacterium]